MKGTVAQELRPLVFFIKIVGWKQTNGRKSCDIDPFKVGNYVAADLHPEHLRYELCKSKDILPLLLKWFLMNKTMGLMLNRNVYSWIYDA
jgi:hypothetical protein